MWILTASKLKFEKYRKFHLMGIGGAGMSGLALLLSQLGCEVSGCDVAHSYYIDKISKKGIDFRIGHSKEHIEELEPDVLVCSSAIPAGNSELEFASSKGIPIYKRAEVLSWLFNERSGIGVAGTHGKTTTASMIGLIFELAKTNPTVAIGGELCDIGGNAKLGKGPYMIAELDESDGSFELFNSEVAIVTNADWDHVDHYPHFHSVISAFKRFLNNRKERGLAVVCGEDKGVQVLMESSDLDNIVTYGWGTSWDWGAIDVVHKSGGGTSFKVLHKGKTVDTVELRVSGDHNVLNALAAYVVGNTYSIPQDIIKEALNKFSGAKRRLQHMGKIGDVDIFDDYGHHPSEINATLIALKKTFPQRRITAIFQPHRYTRTAAMYREFAESLSIADKVYLMPIYPADETPIEGVSSHLIYSAVVDNAGGKFYLCSSSDEVVDRVCEEVVSGDVILTIGAGDVFMIGDKIIKILQSRDLSANAVVIEA